MKEKSTKESKPYTGGECMS